MGMMLRRCRERATEAEHDAEKPKADAKKHEPDEDKHEAEAKKPTKLKRAASSEK